MKKQALTRLLLASFGVFLLCELGAVYGAEKSSGPTAGWINVRQRGLKGDGKANDTTALQAIIDSAPDGSVIYFPAGTYRCRNLYLDSRDSLTFCGDGSSSIIQCALTKSLNTHTIDFTDCNNLTLRNLAFDIAGIGKFGGVGVYGSDGVRVENCRFTDSNPPLVEDTDRFAIAFIGCYDVWFTNNITERTQVEFSHLRRGNFVNNKFLSPVHNGLVVASVHHGTYIEEVVIANNIIESPVGIGIGFGYDPSFLDIQVSKLSIVNNIFRCRALPNTDMICISIGTRPFVQYSQVSGYCRDIIIANNVITYDPQGLNSEFAGIVLAQPKGSPISFRNITIRDNQINCTGKLDPAGKIVYKTLDGKIAAEVPQWREGFGGIYVQNIANSVVEGNSVTGLPWAITVTEPTANLIHRNIATNILLAGYRIENSHGDNVFQDNFVFGQTPKPLLSAELKPSDTIQDPVVKNSVVFEVGDAAKTIELTEPAPRPIKAIDTRTFRGEIVGLPTGDMLVLKQDEKTTLHLRISPWKHEGLQLGDRIEVICRKAAPYNDWKVRTVKMIEKQGSAGPIQSYPKNQQIHKEP